MTGQWRIRIRAELPFPADLPRIGHPGLGLRNLATRAGDAEPMLVTVLDTTDHRLLRAGVLLAHRISDGAGDWYLATPPWRGLDEQVEPLDDEGELPVGFRDVVAPFRRLGTLGPVAALTVERQDYVIRGERLRDGGDDAVPTTGEVEEIGTLRDDRVTVRRSGLTMARFREVTLSLASDRLDRARLDWLHEALRDSGGTVVPAFPSLPQRLGAPATGPTDCPDPAELSTEQLDGLVGRWVATGLRAMIARPDGEAAAELARRLTALTPCLERPWVDDLVTDLGWLASLGRTGPDTDPHQPQGERALGVVETLVQAVRAPRTAEGWPTDTDGAFARLRHDLDDELRDAVPAVDDEGSWAGARALVARARDLAQYAWAERVDGKRGRHRKRAKRFAVLHDQLCACVDDDLPHLLDDLSGATAADAFERGREYERRSMTLARRRESLVADWDAIVDRAAA